MDSLISTLHCIAFISYVRYGMEIGKLIPTMCIRICIWWTCPPKYHVHISNHRPTYVHFSFIYAMSHFGALFPLFYLYIFFVLSFIWDNPNDFAKLRSLFSFRYSWHVIHHHLYKVVLLDSCTSVFHISPRLSICVFFSGEKM